MQVSTMMLAATLSMFGTQNMNASAGSSPHVFEGGVVAIRDVFIPIDLPAQEGGVLESIEVKVGDHVKKGDVLATVDDELEELRLEASEEQLARAKKEASNDINVRYADAGAKVHQFIYDSVERAIADVPESYSTSQQLKHRLTAKQFELQKEQARHELDLAEHDVRVSEAKYRLAKHELDRREIKAPVEGVIEEVKKVEGEWVRAGDEIVRLLQMDRLRVEGYVPYDPLTPADVRGKPVTVTVNLARGKVGTFKGVVDATGSYFDRGEFRVIVEVINRKDSQTGDWMIMPGMDAKVEIHVQ